MAVKDITVQILEQIRDEARGTREEIRVTRTELGSLISQTNVRIDRLDERLTSRIENVEHVLVELSRQHGQLVTWVRDSVANDVADLRRRVSVLEDQSA